MAKTTQKYRIMMTTSAVERILWVTCVGGIVSPENAKICHQCHGCQSQAQAKTRVPGSTHQAVLSAGGDAGRVRSNLKLELTREARARECVMRLYRKTILGLLVLTSAAIAGQIRVFVPHHRGSSLIQRSTPAKRAAESISIQQYIHDAWPSLTRSMTDCKSLADAKLKG